MGILKPEKIIKAIIPVKNITNFTLSPHLGYYGWYSWDIRINCCYSSFTKK